MIQSLSVGTVTPNPGESIMKTVTRDASVSTVYGQKLATPLNFSFGYEELQSHSEIPANEMPDNDAILGLVNTARAAKARSKEQSALLTAEFLAENGIVKPSIDDPAYQLAQVVRMIKAADKNVSDEDAVTRAKAVLGQ